MVWSSTGTSWPLFGFIYSSSSAYVCSRKGGKKNCERVWRDDARCTRCFGGRIALRHSFQKTDDVAVHYLRCDHVRSSAFWIRLLAHSEQRLACSVPVQSKHIERYAHDLHFAHE